MVVPLTYYLLCGSNLLATCLLTNIITISSKHYSLYDHVLLDFTGS